jgi:hypothetical protein
MAFLSLVGLSFVPVRDFPRTCEISRTGEPRQARRNDEDWTTSRLLTAVLRYARILQGASAPLTEDGVMRQSLTCLSRVGERWKAFFVDDVPDDLALCEFDCRQSQCNQQQWVTCNRRIGRARGELSPPALDGPADQFQG